MSLILDSYMTKFFGSSWRTTATGLAALLTGLGGSVNDILAGHMPSTANMALIAAGWVGIQSKDHKSPPVAPA